MKKLLCVLLAVSVILMSGCSATGKSDGNKNHIVAASFYPVYIFTLNLLNGIDGVEVQCMAEQNVGCLHDYTLTSKDAKLLNDADALVINGAGMESFAEDAWENAEELVIIDSSENIKIICDEEHSHEENSHIWLSVENAKKQTENIKNGLKGVFPEYEKIIEENYTEYIERLNVLQEERNSIATQASGKKVISFHAAYSYLAEDLGFEIVDTIESDEGGEPSAKELSDLSDEILEKDIKALFTEPDYSGSAAEILCRETGIENYILNPVTSGESVLTSYEDIMRENYEIILKAVK